MGRIIYLLGFVFFVASSLVSGFVSANSEVDTDNDGILNFQ